MFSLPETYDVIVIGSGHAGIEAALASARIGCRTLMLTQNLDTIGQMSCNPAIGGLAKGQIVREIDALGGAMGLNADATGIQFRMLNRSKGPAVRAPRVQCDKKAYQFRMKAILERADNLDVKQATVSKILVESDTVIGVETDFGLTIHGHSVVVTSGTFLRGLLHIGETSKPGGRMADASSSLSDDLRQLGFESGRFKTGTPCRINGRSIDFDRCKAQPGDEPPPRFSFFEDDSPAPDDIFTLNDVSGASFHVEQMPCWITQTNARTHEIIRANLHRSPLYSGRISGTGPRYCPSIEDKVVKFADRDTHQLFLEPEGRHTSEFYVNGISTSLPYPVQLEFVRSVPALEHAEIMRPGYAVEYDFFLPTQLSHTLETKMVRRLYFAGQVNGTSGYEEAAAQGLVAGANAALSVRNRPGFVLGRNEAYIGVLIDDLVTKGTEEPYRMFTSRAEDRLQLRHDNADQRLTAKGFGFGLVTQKRLAAFESKMSLLNECRMMANTTRLGGAPISQLLKRPGFTSADLPPEIRQIAPTDIWELLETDIKYEGYTARQTQHNRELSKKNLQRIPDGFDFASIAGLSSETRQKLLKIRPLTVGQATRISGVTPADISILSIWLTKRNLKSNTFARPVGKTASSPVFTFALVALVAYFLGSIPSGYIAGRIAGVDVRKVGSGNVGATNVTRVLGKRFGYPVFIVDFAKGLAAVAVAVMIAKADRSTPKVVDLCGAVAAIFSVIGHSYPIWLGFKGGKGVATSLGSLFGLHWISAAIVGVVWVVAFQLTRYVSLSSVIAAIALPVTVATMLFLKQLQTPVLLYFTLCLAAIIVLRHRSNLSRLLKGTEPRFARK